MLLELKLKNMNVLQDFTWNVSWIFLFSFWYCVCFDTFWNWKLLIDSGSSRVSPNPWMNFPHKKKHIKFLRYLNLVSGFHGFNRFASWNSPHALGNASRKKRAEVHSRAWRNCVCSCQMVACSVKSRGQVTHGIPWKFPMISMRSSLYSQIPVQKDIFLDNLHIHIFLYRSGWRWPRRKKQSVKDRKIYIYNL